MKRLLPIILTILLLVSCTSNETGQNVRDLKVRTEALRQNQKKGNELRNASKFAAAIAVHDSCIVEACQLHDTIQWVMALNNQGTNYRRIGDAELASHYHYQALELCESFSDTTTYDARKNLVRSFNGLGNVFLTLGDLEVAEKMFRDALRGETALKSHLGRAINFANLGAIKEQRQQYDSARIYYKWSLQENRLDSNRLGTSICYQNLGQLEQRRGNVDGAIREFYRSYHTCIPTGDVWHTLNPCLALAEAYLSLGRLDSASYFINIVIDESRRINSREHLADAYSLRSKLFEAKGSAGFALNDIRLSYAIKDSIRSADALTSAINERLSYETGHYNQHIEKANEEVASERKLRNVISIGTAALFILVVAMVFALVKIYRLARKKEDLEQRDILRSMIFSKPADIVSAVPAPAESVGASEAEVDGPQQEQVMSIKQEDNPPSVDEFIVRVDNLIENHLAEGNLSSSKLASLIYISPSHLNRRIKSLTGLTTTNYIRNKALMRARQLLTTTNKPISEIEALCGFETTGYFARTFHEIVGMTPTDYRKYYQRNNRNPR